MLPALAEADDLARQAGFDAMADFAGGEGFDAWGVLEALLRGETDSPEQVILSLLDGMKASIRETLRALVWQLAVPVIACAALRLLPGRNPAALGMSHLLCALCCGTALGGQLLTSRASAEALLDMLNQASDVMAPVLVSASTLTGASTTASLMTPLAAECAGFIDYAMKGVGLKLCMTASVVAVAGNLSARFPMARAFGTLKAATHWLLGLSLFVFGGLMSVNGLLGAKLDSVSVRTARMAIEDLIPIVGGEISNSAGSLAAGARLVRQSLGFTGVLFIAHICLSPMTALGVRMMAIRLIAAALEPVAGRSPAVSMIGQFGEILEMLLAICACAAAVTMLLLGGCAGMLGNL